MLTELLLEGIKMTQDMMKLSKLNDHIILFDRIFFKFSFYSNFEISFITKFKEALAFGFTDIIINR